MECACNYPAPVRQLGPSPTHKRRHRNHLWFYYRVHIVTKTPPITINSHPNTNKDDLRKDGPYWRQRRPNKSSWKCNSQSSFELTCSNPSQYPANRLQPGRFKGPFGGCCYRFSFGWTLVSVLKPTVWR